MSYEKMEAAITRFVEKHGAPETVKFSGESLREISANLNEARRREADGRGEAKLILRNGLSEAGEPETWVHVKVGDKEVGVTDAGVNCPPHPPPECE